MNLIHAIILGIVEGITEFLPISSTGHLTIVEKLLGYTIDDPAITAFTAAIQIGAIVAAIWYFRGDIMRILSAWVDGLLHPHARKKPDYKYGWALILGSLPIAVVGLLFHDTIETTLRSMWWVAGGLIGWSVVMWLADRYASQQRAEKDVTWKDTVMIGVAQCIALIPGVSRSGATMSAGLFAGLDRLTATRLSFFLGIPALLAAGTMQAVTKFDDIAIHGVGWGQTIVATIVSGVVGYLSIAWLLKFVARHNFNAFVGYRIALGLIIIMLLMRGTITAN